jgi:hypothetical protein
LVAANIASEANIATNVLIRFESRGATGKPPETSGVAAPPSYSFAVVIGTRVTRGDPSA